VSLAPAKPDWVRNREAIPPPPTVVKLSYGPGVPGWPKEYQEPAEPHPPIMSHNFMYLQPLWMQVNGKRVFEERQICARIPQPAGQGYFAVLYPRKHEGEPVPAYAAWADGAGAKLTLPEEMHYVLLASAPVQVKDGDVAADAAVALVKRSKDRVTLTLIQGQSIRAGECELAATQPATVEVVGKVASGTASGGAQTVTVRLPFEGRITVDGKPAGQTRHRAATITVPSGEHTFRVE